MTFDTIKLDKGLYTSNKGRVKTISAQSLRVLTLMKDSSRDSISR